MAPTGWCVLRVTTVLTAFFHGQVESMGRYRIAALFSSLITLVAGGTVFFKYIEGWSWIDAYFFTVVTLSTVGYGRLVPETFVGKIGATVFIFVGLGVFAVAIQQIGFYALRRREAQLEQREQEADDESRKP